MDRFVGRFSVIDGVQRRVTTDEARKTRVATFPGEHYSSEFENGQLHVYSHTDEHGNPARDPCCVNCASASCDEKSSAAKIRTDARNSHACEIGQTRSVIEAPRRNCINQINLPQAQC